jgi:hypothetical protein
MKTVARLLLLLVVAFTVPVQGTLAVTMGQCRALEHHGDASGGHDASVHEAVKASGHEHDSSSQEHDHTGESGAQGEPGLANSDDSAPSAGHCGPCSGCCASPAISGPAQPQLARVAASLPQPQADSRRISAGPSRLDRPPLAL